MQIQYRSYSSSQDPTLKLFANFILPGKPCPILVSMHGWHGQVKNAHADNIVPPVGKEWFVIEPEMRGRGDSTGKQDANGWELNDVVDAVEFAKKEYASLVSTPDSIYLVGGSGGGGNVLGLVGKFPDYFCAAVCESGISDYKLWFEHDEIGEFRDELETEGWIGGSPATNGEAYASRGGLTTIENLHTPLAIVHGSLDPRCPVEQARCYVQKAQLCGKSALVHYLELPNVGASGGHFGGITTQQSEQRREFVTAHFAKHRQPINLPEQGRVFVAGFLKTKRFRVVLEDINHIAELQYDLKKKEFVIHGPSIRSAQLEWFTGSGWRTDIITMTL